MVWWFSGFGQEVGSNHNVDSFLSPFWIFFFFLGGWRGVFLLFFHRYYKHFIRFTHNKRLFLFWKIIWIKIHTLTTFNNQWLHRHSWSASEETSRWRFKKKNGAEETQAGSHFTFPSFLYSSLKQKLFHVAILHTVPKFLFLLGVRSWSFTG